MAGMREHIRFSIKSLVNIFTVGKTIWVYKSVRKH